MFKSAYFKEIPNKLKECWGNVKGKLRDSLGKSWRKNLRVSWPLGPLGPKVALLIKVVGAARSSGGRRGGGRGRRGPGMILENFIKKTIVYKNRMYMI